MPKLLRYCQYRWQAKGRHGTHSPFVYAFVEQVLRSPQKKISSAQIVDFLKAQQIIQTSNALRALEYAQPLVELPENTLWIVQSTDLHSDWLRHIRWPQSGGLLLWQPHANNAIAQQWQELTQQANINRTMDTWDFGLVLQSPKFLQKQHFLLR